MVKYHPDVRFLTDYAAGSLPRSQALCVASHLHYCPACNSRVRELTELGSELFMQQKAGSVSGDAFQRLVGKIRADGAEADIETPPPPPSRQATGEMPGSGLPRAIARLCGGNLERLPWRRIGKRFRFTPLKLGDVRRETSLLQIRAGGSVPHHRHGGDEITVVLQGSFSDHEDKYNVGDFIVRTRGESHRPVASQDDDCLCLTTLDAPIVMSNRLLRLLLPLITPRQA